MDFLVAFGATPTKTRVCVDRNRVTGGGVTAGIDFALTLVSLLVDRRTAEAIQLRLEYNPAPPFNAGSPDTAPPEILAFMKDQIAAAQVRRGEMIERAAARLQSGDAATSRAARPNASLTGVNEMAGAHEAQHHPSAKQQHIGGAARSWPHHRRDPEERMLRQRRHVQHRDEAGTEDDRIDHHKNRARRPSPARGCCHSSVIAFGC